MTKSQDDPRAHPGRHGVEAEPNGLYLADQLGCSGSWSYSYRH